jgi:hypothetical protein
MIIRNNVQFKSKLKKTDNSKIKCLYTIRIYFDIIILLIENEVFIWQILELQMYLG